MIKRFLFEFDFSDGETRRVWAEDEETAKDLIWDDPAIPADPKIYIEKFRQTKENAGE